MNRRAIIKGASTTLAALTVPALASAAASDHPDAELLRLADELEAIRVLQDKLWQTYLQKSGQARQLYPPKPEVTLATREDVNVFGFPPPTESFGKRVTHYDTFMRQELAECICRTVVATPVKEWLRSPAAKTRATVIEGRVWTSVPCPDANARKLAILEGIDAWKAECNVIDTQCGLDEFEVQFETQNDAFSDTLDQIEAIEAKTLVGLQAKVRAIVCLHEGGAIAFEETTDERIASQVMNALAGSASIWGA